MLSVEVMVFQPTSDGLRHANPFAYESRSPECADSARHRDLQSERVRILRHVMTDKSTRDIYMRTEKCHNSCHPMSGMFKSMTFASLLH